MSLMGMEVMLIVCPPQSCGCDALHEKLSNSRSGHYFVNILLILLLKMVPAPWPNCWDGIISVSHLSLRKFYYLLKTGDDSYTFLIVKLICRARVMAQWAKHLLGKLRTWVHISHTHIKHQAGNQVTVTSMLGSKYRRILGFSGPPIKEL